MSRAASCARIAAAPLALAALLLSGDLAGADPPAPSGAATQIGQTGAALPDTSADQLLNHDRTGYDTSADQLSNHARTEHDTAAAPQLAPPPSSTGPAQLTHPAVGRNTQVVAVVGHDRCDPGSHEAKSPDCARIPENHPEDFQTAETDAATNTVDPNAPSQDLVNGILSSGTGTVVQLPPN